MKKVGSYSLPRGFTIVELLIAIVIIGILAAIVIAVYAGVQNRAKEASLRSDMANWNKKVKLLQADLDAIPTPAQVLASDSSILRSTKNVYSLVSYCASSSEYVVAAELTDGRKFYHKGSGVMTEDSNINSVNPCTSVGVSGVSVIYGGMPTSACAGENATCSFSGVKTIAYGSIAQGKFTAKSGMSSPVSCTNAFFTDPAYSYAKACYVLDY